jgi:hypothetical protein
MVLVAGGDRLPPVDPQKKKDRRMCLLVLEIALYSTLVTWNSLFCT